MKLDLDLFNKLKEALEKTTSSSAFSARALELVSKPDFQELVANWTGSEEQMSLLASFLIAIRQMGGSPEGEELGERFLFDLFKKIEEDKRASFFTDLDKAIKARSRSVAKSTSSILFLDPFGISLPLEEMELVAQDSKFEFLSEFLDQIGSWGWEDFFLEGEEIKKLFHCIEALVQLVDKPSWPLIILYNDFIVRLALDENYVYYAD